LRSYVVMITIMFRLVYFAPYVHFDDRTCTDYDLIYHSADNPQHDTDVAKSGLTAASTEATDLKQWTTWRSPLQAFVFPLYWLQAHVVSRCHVLL
jgi:hypothetical protein